MNVHTYARPDVVAWYANLDGLVPAEGAIAELVFPDGPVDMVDIGIGAGRTTRYLAHGCHSYLGFDYAASMVDEARRANPDVPGIFQADACDMHQIPDASADFVLFSFNGIDSVNLIQRAQVLKEVRRICRPGARFAFSTHSLNPEATRRDFAPKLTRKGLAKWAVLQLLNFPLPLRLRAPYTILRNGAHRFGLKLFYIRVDVQMRQLAHHGFGDIRVFGYETGEEIMSPETSGDAFPFFLCKAV